MMRNACKKDLAAAEARVSPHATILVQPFK